MDAVPGDPGLAGVCFRLIDGGDGRSRPGGPHYEPHPRARCAHVNMKLGLAAIACQHCTHAPMFTPFQTGFAMSARGLLVAECT